MNHIFEYLFHETNIDIDDTEPNEMIVVATSNHKFTITRLENGFAIIKVNEYFIPLMKQFIDIYRSDVFSDTALDFIKEHFRLNSTQNPLDYIYGISNAGELTANTILESTEIIPWETLKNMQPNKFIKYPFKHPNEKLIYFGTYMDEEVVSLASGYMGDFKAVELTGETLPEHRKKGYAKSNTAAIAKFLLANGYAAFTTNGMNNKASIQTVESLGFQRYGCQIAFFADR